MLYVLRRRSTDKDRYITDFSEMNDTPDMEKARIYTNLGHIKTSIRQLNRYDRSERDHEWTIADFDIIQVKLSYYSLIIP